MQTTNEEKAERQRYMKATLARQKMGKRPYYYITDFIQLTYHTEGEDSMGGWDKRRETEEKGKE